jgi:hypothetical protein
VKHLLLDLASIECRLAALALAGGKVRQGSELLSRAMWLLRLRDASRTPDQSSKQL